MSNCTIEQPVFASNYIKGTIRAAPDGKCLPSKVHFSPQKVPEDSSLAHVGIQTKATSLLWEVLLSAFVVVLLLTVPSS